MAKPSGMFQAVCIVAIVLGALGLLTGLFGLVSLAGGKQLQDAIAAQGTPFGPVSEEQRALQRAMSDEIQQATAPWRSVLGALLAVHFLVAVGLVAGGIGTLRRSGTGRVILLGALALAILLEAGRLVPNIAIQQKSAQVTSRRMPEIMRTSQPQGRPLPPQAQAQVDAATGAMMRASLVFGLILGVLLVLAKVGFYVFGFVYLRRPNVRALFEPPTLAEFAPGPR